MRLLPHEQAYLKSLLVESTPIIIYEDNERIYDDYAHSGSHLLKKEINSCLIDNIESIEKVLMPSWFLDHLIIITVNEELAAMIKLIITLS